MTDPTAGRDRSYLLGQPPHPPIGDPTPSAVWTFVGGLIIGGIRARDALPTARGNVSSRRRPVHELKEGCQ